ncbi:MAG: phenylalanine--tRNA ligase subunit alpha [Proteobacteria bacterium]|nr:phenylalanine--tRNA ligase subunit alpha [Pseudomonadota bacterium]MBU1716758.1 phenylalanine--tRNA ligase subunit alpha [Pseudomonadota bacterium]
MEEELLRLKSEALAKLASISQVGELEDFRVKYLGRKGLFTGLMRSLGTVSTEDRPRVGKLANDVKQEVESEFLIRQGSKEGSGQALQQKVVTDLSLPGRALPLGRLHPVTQIMEEVCAIFEGLGFEVAEGPDVEVDFYNFEALNIPKHHPARDMHDTFYVSDSVLLRTHTSPMQVRAMEKRQPPLRMIAPGKVYRCDSDITHTPMFHQVEGFLVDRKVSFADLKGILSIFIARIFDEHTSIRFRPSYFPFTEPSAEVDIACVMCGGKGCRVCKQTGWLEILGAGLIDPEVFKKIGYDPEEYSGFAFGLGIERIAMLKYGINDIRLYYENDLRFLSQF